LQNDFTISSLEKQPIFLFLYLFNHLLAYLVCQKPIYMI